MTDIGKPCMVVAEDDIDLGELLKIKFESLGFKVFIALDGVQALELIEQALPSIVVLDIVMPGLSGMEVLQQIRATPAIAAIPVVLMTSNPLEKDIVRSLSLGIVAFVTKPFSLKDIATVVQGALSRL